LGETKDSEELFSEMFPQNSKRVQEQQKAPLRVIIGNPPYSIGQKSANDNSENQKYTYLEKRIETTYAVGTAANSIKALYDAYIKAFRWASDRLDPNNGGIICFVSNGAWIDTNGMDGFRKSIEKEFSSIYVFNLRGNQRTSGELSRKEGGKIFGSGSRTPIAVTLLVKKPGRIGNAKIRYHEVEDYLTREDKLTLTKNFGSISNPKMQWQVLQPNEYGDWINHRNDSFSDLIALTPDKKFDGQTKSFFTTYSLGIATAADTWMYNFSYNKLSENIQSLIGFYNNRLEIPDSKFSDEHYDKTKISWNDKLKNSFDKGEVLAFSDKNIVNSIYRPFQNQHVCFEKAIVQRTYQQDKFFPLSQIRNLIICVSGLGGNKQASVLISDKIVDLNLLEAGAQCFPLYW
jgi:predicted helicase